VEKGSLSRTLAFDCGHGDAQEKYALKRERSPKSRSIFGISRA